MLSDKLEIIKSKSENELKKINTFMQSGGELSSNILDGLFYPHARLAIIYLLEKKLVYSKYHFSVVGTLDYIDVKMFNSRFLEYGTDRICWAILSDNYMLYEKYAELRFGESPIGPSMEALIGKGLLTLTPLMLFALKKDMKALAQYLDKLKNGELTKKKNETLLLDAEFFTALLNKDKLKIEAVLAEFVSPKIHKRRNNDPFFSEFISVPAVGYAKLAWINGIEVEINSPLIPKELLPISPIDSYEMPYEFLKTISA